MSAPLKQSPRVKSTKLILMFAPTVALVPMFVRSKQFIPNRKGSDIFIKKTGQFVVRFFCAFKFEVKSHFVIFFGMIIKTAVTQNGFY